MKAIRFTNIRVEMLWVLNDIKPPVMLWIPWFWGDLILYETGQQLEEEA